MSLFIRRYFLQISIILGIFGFLLFYLFSWQVKQGTFTKFSFDTTVRLQGKSPVRLDEVWEDLSYFVSPVLSVVWVGVLTLLGVIIGKTKKAKAAALLIPICFGLMIVAEIYGKLKVESPAPPFFMLKNPTTIFPKYHVQEAYSYPSGHAARSMYLGLVSLGLLLPRLFKRKYIFAMLTVGIVTLIAAISVGKVILGQHWIADTIGGWIVACACVSFALSFWLRLHITKQ